MYKKKKISKREFQEIEKCKNCGSSVLVKSMPTIGLPAVWCSECGWIAEAEAW